MDNKNIRVGIFVADGTEGEIYWINASKRYIVMPGINNDILINTDNVTCDAWVNLSESNDNERCYWNIRATKLKNGTIGVIVKIDKKYYAISSDFKWSEENSQIELASLHKIKCAKDKHKINCSTKKSTKNCMSCREITSVMPGGNIKYIIDNYNIWIGIDTNNHFFVECEVNGDFEQPVLTQSN